jgi:SAM-dependent methyltransferase
MTHDGRDRGDETRERWAREITERAAAFWTPARTRGLLGDKVLLLPPVEAAPLLRGLGLLQADGSMLPSAVRKYMQVSHMVALLECAFLDLVRAHPVVRVLDAGCGSSYLTLLLAWCFEHRWRHPAQLVGVDRNADVIEKCRRIADMALLDSVRFEVGDLSQSEPAAAFARSFGPEGGTVAALLALHACDTATDHAIAMGVEAGADLIAVAPCCQAELARKWAAAAEAGTDSALAPVMASPHLRREAAATLTNAMRMLLLRAAGYDVTAAEFVPMSHTPKNTLLRAQRGSADREEARRQVEAMRGALGGCGIRLEELLADRWHRGGRLEP